jgi:transposase
VIHATGSLAAACVLGVPPACGGVNLPDHRVLDALDLPGGGRQVLIESTTGEAGCPTCGVLSARVHQRTHQRLPDVPVAGPMEVVLVKRRFACTEAACPRRSFVEVSDQVPLRARLTTRPRAVVLEAVVTAGRVVAEVAAAHDLSWWTVQKVVNAAADVFTDPDDVPARRLGVDEHRYRSVRFFRDEHGAWRRYEPGAPPARGGG